MDFTEVEIERFKSKIEISESGCWHWTGAKFSNGYSMVCIRRGKKKTFLAHRISWMMFNKQSIPDGKVVRHKCDNKQCVNPDHLCLGTYQENNLDTVRRGRSNHVTGEQCPWAKLTDQQVIEILQSDEKQVTLAKRYNVNQATISQIKNGNRRKSISSLMV